MRRLRISLRLPLTFAVSVAVTLAGGLRIAHADDEPCAGFTWDVRHEQALFGNEPQPLTAGQSPAALPSLSADRLYRVELRGESEVKFLKPPGRKRDDRGGYAGLARLTVDTDGVYRISLDQPLWVDVIADGAMVPAKDFQGRRGCSAPHKVVEFLLPARVPITLQFSGGNASTVKVTVTHS